MNRLPRIRRTLAAGLMTLGAASSVSAIDLGTAYQKALQYDSELAAALATRDVETANTDLSRAALMPKVAAGGSLSHSDIDADRRGGDSYHVQGAQLSVTQPVLALDSLYAYRASQSSEARAEEDYRQAQLELVFRTADAYFTVLRTLDDLETARKAESAFRRQWEQAKERFEVGLIAITEVHETQAIYDSGKATRIAAQGQVDIAVEALQRITGEVIDRIHPLGSDLDEQAVQFPPLTELEQSAQANNPLIQAATLSVQTARQNLESKRAGYYPTVDLEASYGLSDYTGPSFEDNQSDASIALNLNVPIWLGGSTQASERQARAQLIQAEQALLTVQRNVRVQLRSLYSTLRTNRESIGARRQETISNESALQATRAGYDVGTRNIVEVLDAERKYYAALSAYANARYDFILNWLRLQQTTGLLGLPDIERLNRVLTAPVAIGSPS